MRTLKQPSVPGGRHEFAVLKAASRAASCMLSERHVRLRHMAWLINNAVRVVMADGGQVRQEGWRPRPNELISSASQKSMSLAHAQL